MDPSLKRRLFIAIIIIALVVIFLPIPFGHVKFDHPNSAKQKIPSPPEPTKQSASVHSNQSVIAGFKPIHHIGQPVVNPYLSKPKLNAVNEKEKAPKAGETIQNITPSSLPAVNPTTGSSGLPVTMSKLHASKPDKAGQLTKGDAKQSRQKQLIAKPTSKQHSQKKTKHDLDDLSSFTSPVIERINTQDDKQSIDIRRSALNQSLPQLHLRSAHADSTNAAVAQQVKQNLAEAKKMNQAWVAQLGSFNDKKRSGKMVSKLRKQGYAAFSYKTKVKKQVKYRVYVGPFLREEQANNKLGRIKKRFGLPGYIHKFEAARLD